MRILVLGAAGMVGHKIYQRLSRDFADVWATIHKPIEYYRTRDMGGFFSGNRVIESFEVTDEHGLHALLERVRPDVIVNCIGLTWRKDGGANSVGYIKLNALLPHQLDSWCERQGGWFLNFSTDCVFSGDSGSYSETSLPDARHMYGRTKVLGEVESSRALIIRTSVIGRELENHTELLEWFLSQRGKTIKGFRQALYSGVTTNFLAQVVSRVIRERPDLRGLYHLSAEPISKYDLLRRVKDRMRLDVTIVPDDGVVVRKDLIGSKIREATGILTPSWDEMIAELADDPTPYQSKEI